jgi:hypothetical protein
VKGLMRNVTRRLQKLEAIRPPVFCDGAVVTDVALKKLSMAERKVLQEARQRWRDEDRTEAHWAVCEKWERALAEAITETGFPVRMTARDWDFRDDELENLERLHPDP